MRKKYVPPQFKLGQKIRTTMTCVESDGRTIVIPKGTEGIIIGRTPKGAKYQAQFPTLRLIYLFLHADVYEAV